MLDSLHRHLRTVTQTEKAKLFIDDKPLINFSSNNYLGLARHPQVLDAVKQVLEHWGVGATSSRLISGNSIIHQDLESALAAFVGKEAALLFPTGYMANLGVVTSLVGPGDAVIMDRLCHASLVDAARLSGARLFVYEHTNIEAAGRALERAESFRRRLLITESLFSMDGDFAPLAELRELAVQHDAISFVDEAHALGVWGPQGQGLAADSQNSGFAEQRIRGTADSQASGTLNPPSANLTLATPPSANPPNATPPFDIVAGTLSKSLGSQGGFIAGSKELIDTLVNKARSFIYTTGLSPACVAAAQASLSLVQEDEKPRARVQSLSLKLREGLQALGFDCLRSESQIVPIWLGDVDKTLACAEYLMQAGIFAPAIRPPTVHAGECRIRFSVTSDHQESDIDQLLNALATLTPTLSLRRERAVKPGEGES